MPSFVRKDDQETSRDLITRSSGFEKEIFSWPINLEIWSDHLWPANNIWWNVVCGNCQRQVLLKPAALYASQAEHFRYILSQNNNEHCVIWHQMLVWNGLSWWVVLFERTNNRRKCRREGGRTHFVGAETTNLKCP